MSLVNKIYKSRSVIIEMLKLRGIDASNYNKFTQNEIDIMFKSSNQKNQIENSSLDIEVNNEVKILVKYIYPAKNNSLNLNFLDELIDLHFKEGDTLILIVLGDDNKKIYEEIFDFIYTKKKVFIQLFWLNKIIVNITKHSMVPKHTLVSDGEKKELLKKFNLSSFNQFPIILKTDPVAKFIGMRRGDLCRIERSSETAGIYTSYRYCL